VLWQLLKPVPGWNRFLSPARSLAVLANTTSSRPSGASESIHEIDRVPALAARVAYAKQAIHNKLIEHQEYIARYGDDMPEITGWKWGQAVASGGVGSTEADNV
jgi:XFP C-terminal domain